jgi:hypothetical protein
MIDKARAKAASTRGEYLYSCPLDRSLLELLGVEAETFLSVARDYPDEGVVGWLAEHAAPPSAAEVESWNRAFLGRGPSDEDGYRRFLELRERLAPGRTDLAAWVDLIDLEEGRHVPQRS